MRIKPFLKAAWNIKKKVFKKLLENVKNFFIFLPSEQSETFIKNNSYKLSKHFIWQTFFGKKFLLNVKQKSEFWDFFVFSVKDVKKLFLRLKKETGKFVVQKSRYRQKEIPTLNRHPLPIHPSVNSSIQADFAAWSEGLSGTSKVHMACGSL